MRVYHLGSKKVYEVVGTVLVNDITNFVLANDKGYFTTAPINNFKKYVNEEYRTYCSKGVVTRI